MAPSAYACNDIAATRSALASNRRSRSRRTCANAKLRRVCATSAPVSRRTRSSAACARYRAAAACRTSPPFQLKSGNGRERPTVGRRPRCPPGSSLSKPTWRLGAAKTLRCARVSARSEERRLAAAAATGSGSPAGGPKLSRVDGCEAHIELAHVAYLAPQLCHLVQAVGIERVAV